MTDFIKQKTKALAVHKSSSYALIALIFAAVLFYMYYANMAVRTLASLEKAKQQMQSLNVEVSEMESKRLSIENNMNAERALQLGFVEVNNPVFIVKTSKKTTLSLKID